jgi:hypothetical protein
MSMDPKSANKPKKELAPDDPSRDENHDESRINPLDVPADEDPKAKKR